MTVSIRLPDRRVWLRVADPSWRDPRDPLDPSHARARGGRWNPPGSHVTLYLNGDVGTAHAQIERMLAGSPVGIEDLDDDAYVLVAVTLPRAQVVADGVSETGVMALGLPASYPSDDDGNEVGREVCQAIGFHLWDEGLRGVWCRSACTADGRGRELAWYPLTARSVALALWDTPLPLRAWRHATDWSELGLRAQPDPEPTSDG